MNLKKAIKDVYEVMPLIIGIGAFLALGPLIVGVIAQVGAGGTVDVPAAIQTFLNGTLITNIVSIFTSLNSTVVTVVSLIVVAVLLTIVGLKLFGGGKKGSSM